jgi:hypothetical protein
MEMARRKHGLTEDNQPSLMELAMADVLRTVADTTGAQS